MDVLLTDSEIRVLSCLVEKEFTTPDYYPLSLNALINACNQKSNRDPVMSLSEEEVIIASDSLKSKHLLWRLETAGGRVPKYEHNGTVHWHLTNKEVAIMCTLMLRGPQTIGEIKNRTTRMVAFVDTSEVEQKIESLIAHENGPFVVRLPRQPGRKEHRYMHLLAGNVEITEETRAIQTPVAKNRIDILEESVLALTEEISFLKNEFENFKKQFE